MIQFKKEEGFILMTTLILMIMLTVLAVTQVSQNSTQTRVSANATDTAISFEKTEGALNEAINQMIHHVYPTQSFTANANGLYLFNENDPPKWSSITWNSGSTISSFTGLSGQGSSYIIEQLPSVVQPGQSMKSSSRVYRVTSRALGQNGNSSVLLQSTLLVQQ